MCTRGAHHLTGHSVHVISLFSPLLGCGPPARLDGISAPGHWNHPFSLVDQGGWHRLSVQADWPALAPASCVTMGKSLGLSVPYFPTYKIGMMVILAPI